MRQHWSYVFCCINPWYSITRLLYIMDLCFHCVAALKIIQELYMYDFSEYFKEKLSKGFHMRIPFKSIITPSVLKLKILHSSSVVILSMKLIFHLSSVKISWYGNVFCIAGLLWRESTDARWISLSKGQWCRALTILLWASRSCWINSWMACEIRSHFACVTLHYVN